MKASPNYLQNPERCVKFLVWLVLSCVDLTIVTDEDLTRTMLVSNVICGSMVYLKCYHDTRFIRSDSLLWSCLLVTMNESSAPPKDFSRILDHTGLSNRT